ncbi:sensor histidine kinase KdpD [Lachnospiraceae bacterium NSJ-143]|nr:sensor histidine kinase KdpD [Lachnospiraceae bacterium NSJ-143]
MEDYRVNPDEILDIIKTEESAHSKGHLKIFFGYAAGVGKTYSMLKAAHAVKSRGIDVVAGYIEPHARPETMALLEGLEKLPAMDISYRNIVLHEFDLDAAIARKPQLILVDELAHTNAPACRHLKRYQDIEELLKAGINVYTTVNVQHIESLNDMIASITGVEVKERIPDFVFDSADQVELVDIEPDELLERLKDGKIYIKSNAQKAMSNFFDIKNLTALKEIALRRCADRINRMSEKVKLLQRNDYYTDEHILVCISSSPTNPKIIRTASRMANAFRGSFTALFVESSDTKDMSGENKRRLRENIHLAEQLGASVETVYGDDIPYQIAEFARLSGVSKVVMGRSSMQRKYIWSKPTLTEKLIILAPNLDVYIIPDRNTPVYKANKFNHDKKPVFSMSDTIKSFSILAGVTAIGLMFKALGYSEANIITIYILGVLITAVVTMNKFYSILISFISVLAFNYFFTVPYYTLKAYDKSYPVTFFVMFVSAFLTSTLAVRMKSQAKQASEAAYRTKILLETNQLIQKGQSSEEILLVVSNQLVKLLRRDIIAYPAKDNSLAEPMMFSHNSEEHKAEYTSSNERAVAFWVYKNNKRAGATTGTLSNAKCIYLAIRAGDNVYGVIGVVIDKEPLGTFENSILLSILGECAMALQNEDIIREREKAAVLAKNEQLRANLLRSISHDLRTPLTSISGNAGILMANANDMDEKSRGKLYADIYDDSMWLINLVENLLSVTRIEDGRMKLHLSAELIDEVINEALKHINRRSSEYKITVSQSDEFILARMDARLIIQVIINIVDNAVKYTPSGSTIAISSYEKNNWVVVDIADNGNGIDDESKKRIFEMFYTANKGIADSRRSLGLGLALCKSIITAHNGEIFVFDNKPKGTVFRFTLPKEEVKLRE